MNRIVSMGQRQILACLSILMLSACSSADEELTYYIHRVKNGAPKPIESIPEFKPMENFIFPENDMRRSPFMPTQHHDQSDANMPNMNRPKDPLEAFPLDALKFVGILKEGNVTWGLIGQPGGLVSKVRVGEYMGKNYGRVAAIIDNKIEIEETILVAGRWEKKKISLNLRTQD